MAFCFGRRQRPYAPSPLIPSIWVPRSAFLPCSILGALTCFIVPTCICVVTGGGVQKWPDIVRLRDAGKLILEAIAIIPRSENALTKIHSGEHGSLILRRAWFRRPYRRGMIGSSNGRGISPGETRGRPDFSLQTAFPRADIGDECGSI